MKDMKKTFRAIVIAAAAVTALVACSKETAPGEAGRIEKGKIGVSVSALMAELTPAEAGTKSSVESVVRLTWEAADTVSAFCGSQYLGYLEVSVSDDNKMVAKLSGEITQPASGTTITLIHSNVKSEVNGGTVSVDLSDQKTTAEDPFVVYGTLDYTGTIITDQTVPFKFATSLMFVTVTGLNDSDVDSVTVSGINTVCRLIVKTDGEPTVEGITPGTITTKVSESCRQGERAIFNIGIVKDNNTGRKISAVQRDTTFRADFTADALATSSSYISVYALKVKETADYVVMKMCSDQSKELKWRKKNIGAEKETDYGDYFAWGATELAYSSLSSNTFTFVASRLASYGGGGWTQSSGFAEVNTPYYNGSGYTKYTESDSKTVLESDDDAAYKEPGGKWRMPTSQEFKDLADACGGSSDYDVDTYKSPKTCGEATTFSKGIYWCDSYDGVAGCLFCDGTNKLFFPAAGSGDGTGLSGAGDSGFYWSSSLGSDGTDAAYGLFFDSNDVYPQNDYYRYYGFPVRPVSD